MQFVSTDIQGNIATVKLDRGDGRNALSRQVMMELRDTALELQQRPELMAVILHGAGDNFSAGADLSDTSMMDPSASLIELRHTMKVGPDMCKAWEDIEAYTVMAIEGYCIGGGVALALSMDYRIMANGGFMRLPEVALGMNMSWNSIPRLVAQIGPARTQQFVTLCDKVQAREALDWGLVEQLVEDGAALQEATAFAERIGKLPPLSVKMTKSAVKATANALSHATSFMDRDQYLLAVQSDDFKEAVTAFFEKREPNFTGN